MVPWIHPQNPTDLALIFIPRVLSQHPTIKSRPPSHIKPRPPSNQDQKRHKNQHQTQTTAEPDQPPLHSPLETATSTKPTDPHPRNPLTHAIADHVKPTHHETDYAIADLNPPTHIHETHRPTPSPITQKEERKDSKEIEKEERGLRLR